MLKTMLVVVMSVTGMFATTARAQKFHQFTFVVNSTDDAVDASVGDGVCETAAGFCTLRAAVQEANASLGADAIILPAGNYTLTIVGAEEDQSATGDLDIADDVTIIGDGRTNTTIAAAVTAFGDRVLHVLNGVQLAIRGVSIEHGSIVCPHCQIYWGGGGIFNEGSLALNHVDIRLNSSGDVGGGIYNRGYAKLTSVIVEFNYSAGTDGGVRNEGTIQFDGGAIRGNTAASGTGGLANWGTATVTNVTVRNNKSGGDTGGVWNLGTLTLAQDTFAGNTAGPQSYGGAVSVFSGTATLTNVTITGNSAGDGGGLSNLYGNSALINVTVDGNSAPIGGNIENQFGTVTLYNTIVANSTSGESCVGIIASGGYNLDSGSTCRLKQRGDLSGVDPLLADLANNGGKTQTQALLEGSPAIDHVPQANCTVSTDQRGVVRPQGIACDIGAFEKQQP
jgi:CSLREA domain-containing protein